MHELQHVTEGVKDGTGGMQWELQYGLELGQALKQHNFNFKLAYEHTWSEIRARAVEEAIFEMTTQANVDRLLKASGVVGPNKVIDSYVLMADEAAHRDLLVEFYTAYKTHLL